MQFHMVAKYNTSGKQPELVLERCSFIWQQNIEMNVAQGNRVLERCSFIWQQNLVRLHCLFVHVLERCSFIWQQNGNQSPLKPQEVLERCSFIWQQNCVCVIFIITFVLERCSFIWYQRPFLLRLCTYLLYMTIQFYTALCLPSSIQYIERCRGVRQQNFVAVVYIVIG